MILRNFKISRRDKLNILIKDYSYLSFNIYASIIKCHYNRKFKIFYKFSIILVLILFFIDCFIISSNIFFFVILY